jgi:predicted aspartyl protease
MGRITVPVTVTNVFDPTKQVRCEALVDTGAYGLVLPLGWRDRLGPLPYARTVELETADARTVDGLVCGPVTIHLEGFDTISGEVTFLEMAGGDTRNEPLVGHTVLQLSRAAVDLVHDRLVRIRHLDLKIAS